MTCANGLATSAISNQGTVIYQKIVVTMYEDLHPSALLPSGYHFHKALNFFINHKVTEDVLLIAQPERALTCYSEWTETDVRVRLHLPHTRGGDSRGLRR
jgi:hypothetical protein